MIVMPGVRWASPTPVTVTPRIRTSGHFIKNRRASQSSHPASVSITIGREGLIKTPDARAQSRCNDNKGLQKKAHTSLTTRDLYRDSSDDSRTDVNTRVFPVSLPKIKSVDSQSP